MRRVEGVPAVLLRRTEYGESDLILSVYCRPLGKLSVLARAARRSRKRFGAALELFTLSEATLTAKPGAQMWNLLSAEPRVTYSELALDVAAMAHGSYGTELVRELSAEEDPEPEVFDLLVALYESLQSSGPRAGRLRVFELRLLQALGLAPVLDRCANCGDQDLSRGAHLDPRRGGMVCAACAAQALGYGVRPLSAEAIGFLRRAQLMHELREGDELEGHTEAINARQSMLSLLYWHVGKPLKSIEFIAKLSNRR